MTDISSCIHRRISSCRFWIVSFAALALLACKDDGASSAERELVEAVVARVGGRAALAKARGQIKVGQLVVGESTAVVSVVGIARGRALRGVMSGRAGVQRWRYEVIGSRGALRRVARACPASATRRAAPAAEAKRVRAELVDLEPLALLARLLEGKLAAAPKVPVAAGQRAIAFELPRAGRAVAVIDARRELLVELRYGPELRRRVRFSRWRYYDEVLYPSEVSLPSPSTAEATSGEPEQRVRWEDIAFPSPSLLKRALSEAPETHCNALGAFSSLRRLLWLSQVQQAKSAARALVRRPTASELPAFLRSVIARAGGAVAIEGVRSLRWRGSLPDRAGVRVFTQLRGHEARRAFSSPRVSFANSLAGKKYRMQVSGDVRGVERDSDDEAGIDALNELVYGDPLRLLAYLSNKAAKPRLAKDAQVRPDQLAVDITLPYRTVATLVFDLRSRLLVEYRGHYGHLGDDGRKQTVRPIGFRDWTFTPSGVLYPLRWRYAALRPREETLQTVVIDQLELDASITTTALTRKPCVNAPRAGCRWP